MKYVCLALLMIFSSQTAWAREITLNGLFADKAIFIIDGEPLLLNIGEEKSGIRLLQVGSEHADVAIDGKQLTLRFEKITPRKVEGAAALKPHDEAKSHIIDVRLIHQTDNIATFEVEYYFNDSEADYAALTAKTLFKDEDTGYWAHSFARLKPGRHITTISISMTADAPETYTSETARFDIRLVKGTRVKHSGTRLLELIKQWRK